MHTSSLRRSVACASLLTLLVSLFFVGGVETAHAQSSWSPTLLVNTESFQTIDDGDGSTDIELRFGSSTQTIKFLTTGRFRFSHSVSVLGNISGSTLTIDGNGSFSGSLQVRRGLSGSVIEGTTVSGTNLFATRSITGTHLNVTNTFAGAGLTSCSGATSKLLWNSATKQFSCGTDVDTNTQFSNTGSLQAAFDNRYVNQSGDTMTGALTVNATLSGRTLVIGGNGSFSGSLRIVRGLSGSVIEGTTVSGTNLFATRSITGTHLNVTNTFAGAGLSSCSGATQKLLWNSSTKQFSCGTDVDTNTQFSNTGSLQAAFDNRYVNQSGDTMTGGLVINLATGTLGLNVKQIISGQTLRIGAGGADIHGALNVSGSILTDANLTINGDAGATNAVLTFGNASGNQNLTFSHSLQLFTLSTGIKVLGAISGSSLTIDNNATISGSLVVKNNITAKGNLSGSALYGAGLGSCTTAGYGLQYNSATGKFNCTNIAAGASNGSGGILSLHAEFPNAVYFASGSNTVGQLTLSGGTTGLNNSYVWTSSRSNIQDYWTSVRVRLPDNFSSWDVVKPIELRYKTGSGTVAANHVTVRMRDTAGSFVTLTGGGGLANTAWTTANITGPESAGTWTPKGYITLYIKHAANSASAAWGTANAAVSLINLNFETTTP